MHCKLILFISIFFLSIVTNKLQAQNGKIVVDIDSNQYKTVKIGKQIWLDRNLQVTRYCNGDSIPNVTDNSAWSNLTLGAYSDYNNIPGISAEYGRLYNWKAVIDKRKICPKGYHVPSNKDWGKLVVYLGGDSLGGNKLKEASKEYWFGSNYGSTNTSGFSAKPAGVRDSNGISSFLHYFNYMWSSTNFDEMNAEYWYLRSNFGFIHSSTGNKLSGFSVRCIKN